MTTPNKVFSVFSFISFVFCFIPFCRHIQARNTGTCLLMGWVGLASLICFINSVIWNDNATNCAPVWCDISSHLILLACIGIPTSELCIMRSLYHIATTNTATVTKAEKRRAILFDLVLGVGVPVIVLILLYIPQYARFTLYGDFGCASSVSCTPIGIVLGAGPHLLIACICAVYSILIVRILCQKRSELKEILSNNINQNTSEYLRILAIAIIGSACLVPMGLYSIIMSGKLAYPWPGWTAIHADMSYVEIIPTDVWRSDHAWQIDWEISRWQFVFNAFIIFAFFGLHEEARMNYRSAMQRVFKHVPCIDVQKWGDRTVPGSLPLAFARSQLPCKSDGDMIHSDTDSLSDCRVYDHSLAPSENVLSPTVVGSSAAATSPDFLCKPPMTSQPSAFRMSVEKHLEQLL